MDDAVGAGGAGATSSIAGLALSVVAIGAMKKPTVRRPWALKVRGAGDSFRGGYAWKLEPQPQVLVALGLLNTKPRPMISSLKSMLVPLR